MALPIHAGEKKRDAAPIHVTCDLLPGMYDEHGVPPGNGQLRNGL